MCHFGYFGLFQRYLENLLIVREPQLPPTLFLDIYLPKDIPPIKTVLTFKWQTSSPCILKPFIHTTGEDKNKKEDVLIKLLII